MKTGKVLLGDRLAPLLYPYGSNPRDVMNVEISVNAGVY